MTNDRRPQQNRVAPTGELIATPARGLFMGNRAYGKRWLVCELHFERELKTPRVYPKVFFLDEAVALAAGHRPCNMCRPQRYKRFLNGTGDFTRADDLDNALHTARTAPSVSAAIGSLPDGAFIRLGDDLRLLWAGAAHRWTPGGYTDAVAVRDLPVREAAVLTPAPSLTALADGYPVVVHSSVES